MLRFTVYDKDLARKGWVNHPAQARVVVRHNQLGQAELTVDADHVRAADLAAPGARCVVDYLRETEVTRGDVLAENLATHPAAQANNGTVADGWRVWPVDTGLTPSITPGPDGHGVAQQGTRTGTGTVAIYSHDVWPYGTITVEAGKAYTVAAAVRSSEGGSVTFRARDGVTSQRTRAFTLAANEWQTLTFTTTAPDGVQPWAVDVVSGSGTVGATLAMTRVMVVAGDYTGAYFDGDIPDTATREYAWTGEPHASASTVREVSRRVNRLPLLSGTVTEVTGEGHAAASTRTFHVADDKRLLWELLGWPNPRGGIDEQGQEGAYWRRAGTAETVVKDAVAANAGRYHLPVTVAPNGNRGRQVTTQLRFHPLADRLFPAVDQAGIGVTVLQDDGALVVDTYVQRTAASVLTEESGVIQGERTGFRVTAPTATRVVVGAGGEGEHRVFARYIDEAREAEWGTSVEVFRDARDIAPGTLVIDSDFTEDLGHWDTFGTVTLTEDDGLRYARITGEGTIRQGTVVDVTPGDVLELRARVRTTATAGTGGFRLWDPATNDEAAGTWADVAERNFVPEEGLEDEQPDGEWRSVSATFTIGPGVTQVAPQVSFASVNAPVDVTGYTVAGGTWVYEPWLAERAAETLAEAAPTTSLDLELAETEFFRFGDAVHLGDIVHVQLTGSPVLTDVVREVEITWDTGQGLVVMPRVGQRTGDPTTVFGKAIASLAKGMRDLKAGR